MKTVAIIQARLSSTRLPGKVLLPLAGRPVLEWVARAGQAIPGIDAVVIATSDQPDDDAVAAWADGYGIACHRGPLDDVLTRFALAAQAENADILLRLTGDCPLLDPQVCGQVLALLKRQGLDYASNAAPQTWPDGLDCEAFTRAALDTARTEAIAPAEREHVTPFIRDRRDRFRVGGLPSPLPGLHTERWTLDESRDLEFLHHVTALLPDTSRPPSHLEILAVLDAHPALRSLNARIVRNEGAAKSLRETPPPPFFGTKASATWLERAEKVIPLASQTFSKSRIQYPEGSPLFLTHGQGGRVWDVDGNRYVDMVCGLLPVVLGYQDPDVDQAIRDQLANGISFSLPTTLETELAERLTRLIPCAEKVRYGKNGTDATSAAIRLARAFTGRDRIATCGYHGWQDWYIGATSRHKGIPTAVRDLTHTVPYNDLAAVDKLFSAHPGQFAALIMEPMNAVDPAPGYLQGLKDLVHAHGALLVFDEVITGFRYALGGAQSLFGVTPDLASFGKAMGNGMPISAIVGRAEVMREMEDVFISGTFGGEALSLAAAIATIDKMEREPVIEKLWNLGATLADGVAALTVRHGLAEVISLVGRAPWKIIAVKDHPAARKEAIKTLFAREMLHSGVLFLASHNVCYAHDSDDVATVLGAWDRALAKVAAELATGQLEARLPYPVVMPVFQVR
ncbi:aminotransferase class III-fold pyridoxal phosphate-dependent enzyme [Magnetospirillum sulfuroxidans]|uniref:Aminotransferase class III-fold pyridoxal phosphate-dependent enzyme n=1 Tax=Magnetospirillum sulfuroxidans TaxID=611300 RepID=A0ABS5IGP9_9PROT|nr:aminotransferase class III-fold pyridoxal phosphate-dependent enzyme [Magnetospirillum sulfuroxidans]MBR9972873.1 aminotransferase class III-fold pyridoxal phosphate-dependent enzyme [Magnetospirillum sulfuroxidans]